MTKSNFLGLAPKGNRVYFFLLKINKFINKNKVAYTLILIRGNLTTSIL